MSTQDEKTSQKRCQMCGKTEDEVGQIVSMPPNLEICSECLQKEMDEMDEVLKQFGIDMSDVDMVMKDYAKVASDMAKKNNGEHHGASKKSGKDTGASDGKDGDKTSDSKSSSTTSIKPADSGDIEKKSDSSDEDADKEDDSSSKSNGWLFGLPGFFTGSGSGGPFAMGGGSQRKKERDPNEPIMAPVPLPHKLKSQLDEYVIGQELAKKIVAVAAYNHYKRAHAAEKSEIEIDKSNILMLGPTGTGKTYLIRTLARLLDVPLAISDATTLTQAGYVGDDIESILTKLIQAADGDVEKAEYGIVYIDEIDKITKKSTSGEGVGGTHDIGGEAVQQGLLKLLEGTKIDVPLSGGMKTPFSRSELLDTKNILFICGGAFPGLEKTITKRLNKSAGIGFGAALKEDFSDRRDIFEEVRTEDLKEYGLIPEFIGRLPILCPMEALDEDMLYDILVKPHDALVKQYQALLGYDDVALEFNDDALRVIAKKALAQDTGARGLRAIIEKFMLNVMYEVPKDKNIGEVIITGDYVEGNGSPIIKLKGEMALPSAENASS